MLQTKRTSTSTWQINLLPLMKANSQYYVLHLVISLLAIVKHFCQKLTKTNAAVKKSIPGLFAML